ncbi:MAG TPA: hypothetical protein VI318_13900, partial [Baekduia sp.]
AARRAELEQALRGTGDHETTNGHGNGNGNGDGAADALIRLALELDALERVQPRVDSWLRITVAAASEDPGVAPFGEGPA